MECAEPNDERCVQNVLAGDREQFALLVNRHSRSVLALAMAHTRNRADAEDVTQETFLKAFRALATLKKPGRFVQWLMTIARNTAMSAAAARREAPLSDGMLATLAADGPDPSEEDLHRLLRAQLAVLDPLHREVFTLHYFGGHGTAEIAAMIAISQHAAKKRLVRARQALGARMLAALGPALDSETTDAARNRRILASLALVRPGWSETAAATGAAAPAAAVNLFGGLAAKFVFAAVVMGGLAALLLPGAMNGPAAFVSPGESRPASTAFPSVAAAPAEPEVSVEPPPSPAPATLQAAPTQVDGPGAIHGFVYDPGGEAPGGADIEIFLDGGPAPFGEYPLPRLVGRIAADGEGHFAAEKLPAGSYILRATTPGRVGTASVHIGHRLGFERETAIALEPGSRIAGKVVDALGHPLPGARVALMNDQNAPRNIAHEAFRHLPVFSDESGAFALDFVPRGDWRLFASADSYPFAAPKALMGDEDVVIVLGGPLALRGTAVSAADQKPVSGAIVIAASEKSGQSMATTGPDGRYAVQGLEAGAYHVSIFHSLLAAESIPEKVRLRANDGGAVKNWELKPGGAVEGRVVDDDTGAPVAGVRVSAVPPMIEAGRTDADGVYRLTGLPTAPIRLRIGELPSGYAKGQSQKEVTVKAHLGRTVQADDFVLASLIPVSGRIVDAAGEAVAHAFVSSGPGAFDFATALSGANGAFTIHVRAQSAGMRLRVEKRGFATAIGAPFDVPAEGVDGLGIVLAPEAVIAGFASDERGRPLPGAQLLVRSDAEGWDLHLSIVSDHFGRFALRGLSSETYTLAWSKPYPDGSAHRIELDTPPLSIEAGQRIDGLRVVIDDTGAVDAEAARPEEPPAELEGRILDAATGEPIPGAEVRIVDAEHPYGGIGRVYANAGDGDYTLAVPLGGVILEARAPGYGPMRSDPIDIAAARKQDGPIFRLEPAFTLRGVVRNDSGEPLAKASIRVDPNAGQGPRSVETIATTGSRGEFAVDGLSASQPAVIGAACPGYADLWMTIDPTAVDGPVEFVMKPGAVVEGAVLFDGQPRAGLTVRLSEESGRRIGEAATGPDGVYRLTGVPSGLIRVEAAYHEPGAAYDYRYQRLAEAAAGDTTAVGFAFQPGTATIRAAVSRPGEVFVAVAIAMADGTLTVLGPADAEGRFEAGGLPGGTASVTVRYKGTDGRYKSAVRQVELAEGRAAECLIDTED